MMASVAIAVFRRCAVSSAAFLCLFCFYMPSIFFSLQMASSTLLSNPASAYMRNPTLSAVVYAAAAAAPVAEETSTDAGGANSRMEKLLKYAEQRADNAEGELKRFRETHEASVRACSEATQHKKHELDSCQQQSESLRQMYNALQTTKTNLEKQLRSAEARLAAASAAGAEKGADLAKKLQEKVEAAERELAAVKERYAEGVAELQTRLREISSQYERLQKRAQQFPAAEGCAGDERHIFSLSALWLMASDIGKLYYSVGEQLLHQVPGGWWARWESVKEEARAYVGPHAAVVYEKVLQPLSPYYAKALSFFYANVYPVGVTALHKSVAAVNSLSKDVVPSVNSRLDAALRPLFQKHPEVESLVPRSFGDRVAFFLFLIFVTYCISLVSFRFILFPILGFLFPWARRQSNKRARHTTVGGGSSYTQKRFVPAAAAGSKTTLQTPNRPSSPSQAGGSGNNKKNSQHANPTRPFSFADSKHGHGSGVKKA